MSTFRVEIETDNAAFDEDDGVHEVARILRKLACDVESGGPTWFGGETTLRDANGNRVGFATFSEEDE